MNEPQLRSLAETELFSFQSSATLFVTRRQRNESHSSHTETLSVKHPRETSPDDPNLHERLNQPHLDGGGEQEQCFLKSRLVWCRFKRNNVETDRMKTVKQGEERRQETRRGEREYVEERRQGKETRRENRMRKEKQREERSHRKETIKGNKREGKETRS